MYICYDCQAEFEIPLIYREVHGEEIEGCPVCGGTYTECVRCDFCDKAILQEYIILKNNIKVCNECYIVVDEEGI